MTTILAIDPGTTESAWALYTVEADRLRSFRKEPNADLLARLREVARQGQVDRVVIEQVESYGMAVGRDIFETVRWAGRFEERAHPVPVEYLPRRAVKLHLCGTSRAKDANVRRQLLDRWGGDSAKGTKKVPGPLYGVSGDAWSALAIAVTYADTFVGGDDEAA